MFKQPKDAKEVESIVGPSVKIKGNFGGEGDIIVEGMIEGTLKSGNTVFINENAKVGGNVQAKNAVIKGEVKGNIKVEAYLEMGESCKVTGDISCSVLSIIQGAKLNGKCEMTADGEEGQLLKEAKKEKE